MTETSPPTTDIVVTRHDKWLEIEIARPDKFNALREQTAAEIMDTMAQADEDDSVTSVILTGSPKAFCYGIDTT